MLEKFLWCTLDVTFVVFPSYISPVSYKLFTFLIKERSDEALSTPIVLYIKEISFKLELIVQKTCIVDVESLCNPFSVAYLAFFNVFLWFI